MTALYRTCRRWASSAKQQLFPTPEGAAWRKACRIASQIPRFTRGDVTLLDYELQYLDLLTICPQWHAFFVRDLLDVQLENPSPRILDCGANIGLATLYFKKRYPEARVSAYEADSDIAEALRGNVERNGLVGVDVVDAAIWTSDGTVDFRAQGADSGTIASFAGELDGDDRAVKSVRLKRLLDEEPVDLLKLDIEGGEEDVLKDCGESLENVRVLLLDIHEFDPGRRRTPAILSLLDEAGFVYSLDELVPLHWRGAVAPPESPFPGTHLCWSVLARAFRP